MGHNERKKGLKADHTAWCGTDMQCGVNLAKILNEVNDPVLTMKVSAIISRADRRIKGIKKSRKTLNTSSIYITQLMYADTKASGKLSTFPLIVQTHLDNLLAAKFRRLLTLLKK